MHMPHAHAHAHAHACTCACACTCTCTRHKHNAHAHAQARDRLWAGAPLVVGGAVLGGGSHGSAPGDGTLADVVTAMRLVTHDSVVLDLADADGSGDGADGSGDGADGSGEGEGDASSRYAGGDEHEQYPPRK